MWLRDPLLPRMSVGSGIISVARIARSISGGKVKHKGKKRGSTLYEGIRYGMNVKKAVVVTV
jgi:hypothetical protein